MYEKLKRLLGVKLQLKANCKPKRAYLLLCKNEDDYYGDRICTCVEQK